MPYSALRAKPNGAKILINHIIIARVGGRRMSVILTLLGIVIATAGVAAIGFGIPINEFTLGTTLMMTGSTALTGGLILIGLGAVVAELARVSDALKGRAGARLAARGAETSEPTVAVAPSMVPAGPSMAAGATPAVGLGAPRPPQRGRPELPAREARSAGSAARPAPAAAPSAVDVSAAAIERLRATIPRGERPGSEPSVVAESEEVPLSPSEVVPQQQVPSGGEAAPFAPKITAEDRAGAAGGAGGAAVEALRASRLDFLFRSKPAVQPAPEPQNADPAWSAESRTTTTAEIEPQQPPVAHVQAPPAQASSEPERQLESAPAVEAPHSAAILKSGVVDGMAYTLYADGSIEATLPHGTVRFGSIAELRTHIESNS
jgi:hypothetical protein